MTNQNGICLFFFKYHHVLSKHWQPSCSIVNVRMRRERLGKALLTRVNSFVEA